MFVNPSPCVLVLGGGLPADRRRPAPPRLANFDVAGAILVTGGMLLLVYALVKAPDRGWGCSPDGAGACRRSRCWSRSSSTSCARAIRSLPLSIFRIHGLGSADVTQLIAFAGFLAMFFFLTLYMQNVLGLLADADRRGIPAALRRRRHRGRRSRRSCSSRVGTRPVIVAGALIAAGGIYLAVAAAGARLLRHRPAARACWSCRSDSARCSSASRRRQRGRPGRQGRAGRRAAQRLAAARRRARPGDLLGDRDGPDHASAGRARGDPGRADLGVLSGRCCEQHLHRRSRR